MNIVSVRTSHNYACHDVNYTLLHKASALAPLGTNLVMAVDKKLVAPLMQYHLEHML